MAMDVGRVCVKIAGREAGKKCVVVDILDKNYALVDGEVKRKKCNMDHLEPLDEKVEIEKNEDHNSVMAKLEKIGIRPKKKLVIKRKEKIDKIERSEKKPAKKEAKEKKEKKSSEKIREKEAKN